MRENVKNLLRKNEHIYKIAYSLYNLPSSISELYSHYKADYYLISFPKCGRTWLRLMMGKYFQKHYKIDEAPKADILEVTPLSNYNSQIPMIRITHDDNPHLKSPDKIENNKSKYKTKKVIFLTRDPRDVVVSLYHQFLKREKRMEKMPLSDFIKREKGSLKSIIKFYNIWYYSNEAPKNFLEVKYENLHKEIYKENRYDELKKVLKFIGFDEIDNELLKYVAEFAAFDNMREMEEKEEFDSEAKRLSPIDKNDEQSYKTRKGKVGGFKEECSEKDIKYMDKYIENNLDDHFPY